ncbi:putative HTLV-1-related endogenous sequence [Lynx rufus]|uniref:putative HTLV-1-related endogenous sequence n=1 Tax=Lynx rufus TaxID=61384 RepID=UPI001F12392A|nr:putative HTLV-1-related endogenous sequence [Lynx rufus]
MWLTGGSDFWLPSPPLIAPEPGVASRSLCRPRHPWATNTRHRHLGTDARAVSGPRRRRPCDPDDLGPTLRHGQIRRRKLSHPATPGGRQARPVGRLPTPASKRASKNETATSWSQEDPQSPRTPDLMPGFPPGASRARAGSAPSRSGPTPPKQPPANPLPPAGALEAGWCARRRRGRDGAGRRDGLAGLGHAPSRPFWAQWGVARSL